MTDPRSQSNYQVRLDWGAPGLSRLAESGIVVIVDALGGPVTDASFTALDDIAGGATGAVVLEGSVAAVVDADADLAGAATGTAAQLVAEAAALPHGPTVFIASLRNATATAKAVCDEQIARGDRTAINLVLAGDGSGGFAVEDYLAAGAIGDALTALGIDHSAPDVAVATEGFRPLTRALKHLLSASSAGRGFVEAGRRDEVRAAALLDADAEAIRFVR